jgi:DNA polymerase alpha subunit B
LVRGWPRSATDNQIVDSSLVINPGYLSKARTAGTFAKLVIHPKDKVELDRLSMEDGEQELEHEVYNRARAETWRI